MREQGLIDDLQYEEVAAELKRSNAPVIQLLQDFGIMKLDDILHVEATALGTEVVSLKDREISQDVLKLLPAKVAQMYHCLPVAQVNGALQVALSEPPLALKLALLLSASLLKRAFIQLTLG